MLVGVEQGRLKMRTFFRVGFLIMFVGVGPVHAYDAVPEEPPEFTIEQACIQKTKKVSAGGFGLSGGSYPCDLVETYAALELAEGRGFIDGTLPRFFLRARLVTRGFFSMIFGLVGLG